MTDLQQKPALAGFFGTILVWILIFLFLYFSALLFAPKPYKSIKIRLDSSQKIENKKLKTENPVQESSAQNAKVAQEAKNSSQEGKAFPPLQPPSASSASPSAGAAPATPPASAAKKIEQPKKTSVPATKTAPKAREQAKTAPQQPKMAEQTLQKSMEELIAEQQTRKTVKKEFDWSQFDDIEGSSSSNQSSVTKIPGSQSMRQSTFSGSAATSSSNDSSSASVSSSNSRSSVSQGVSSATANALASAVSAKLYSSSSGGLSSSVTANTGSSSDGKVALQMSDGTPRILLEPAEPKIILSPEASALIDSTKRLTVSFTVMASGNVPLSSVRISPDILPSLVSMEIRDQIARWRFQAASYDGTARFEYTIQKN